jgi:serine/threonine protein kinase
VGTIRIVQAGEAVGPYTLITRLGAGAMGEVWRARAGDATDIALKIPRRPAFLRHLRREGVLLEKIDHPRVARLLEASLESDPAYLAMEYVKGESLRSLCRGRISGQQATLLSDQILEGLGAIHAAGILHLDLKPENVLVQEDGSAKIVDLGLGRATSALMAELFLSASLASRDLPVAGTLAYMAPEQRKGKAVDARADLFAFGVLLHELLSGKLPDPATRLSRMRKDLTPRWDVVVAKLTHPEPASRPQSAKEARQLIAFTLQEKMHKPIALGGLEPRDLASFDEEALAYESPWKKGMTVGDCELEEPLGRGGFGEVWRARRGEERVALKLALRDEARAALGIEAQAAARIQHPGIPRVLEDRSGEDPPHVVFALAPGTSLRALLNEKGLAPVHDSIETFALMVEVVKACHAVGVVHHDLKPEHFLVARSPATLVSLIDFGLANLAAKPGTEASLASRHDARGTYDYMAPELREGREGGPAADVYALGVSFFEMLTGELPRGSQSARQLRREVLPEIDELTVAMIAVEPGRRPSLERVASVLGDHKLERKVRTARYVAKWRERFPWLSPFVNAAVARQVAILFGWLLLAGVLALFAWYLAWIFGWAH